MKYADQIVEHRKNDDFEYLTFKKLDKYGDKLIHGITLRHGGVSNGVYSSLNVRNVGKDDITNVKENVNIICKNLGIDYNNICKASQNHTDDILVLSGQNKNIYQYENFNKDKYDAYIIKDSGISTFITTADCNPIIIYDKKQNIVSAVHAGWKGVIKQIYLKTIRKLIDEFNSKKEDLIVCIGPSIRSCCFSSEEEDFKKKFTDIWENENEYVEYEAGGKRFHIDLIYLIKKDLKELGILEENIEVANICTCCNSDDFFSYRISTRNKDEDYATFATVVGLK